MKIRNLVLSVCLIVMSGCGGCGSGNTWTIFVYGHGDHNLSGSLMADINKMAAATLTGDVKVIVAADFDSSAKDSTGTPFPTGTTWYSITGGGEKTIIRNVEEQNLDDPTVLAEAIKYVIGNYPSDHYGIIMWDHGGAWDGGFGGDTQDGTLPAAQVRGMTNVEVRDAIVKGFSSAGPVFKPVLDFIAFDTCLLGSAEAAYLFRSITNIYIANAELDFGAGWNYTDTLTALAAKPSMTPVEFATMELEKWDALHKTASNDDLLLRSHTSLDTSKIDIFAAAMKDLVIAIEATKSTGVLPSNGDVYARASAFALPSYGKTAASKTENSKYRDVGQFLRYLVVFAPADISAKAQAAIDATSAMQIGRDYGTLRDPASTYQLAFNIALPEISSITDELLSDYAAKAGDWTATTGWKDFLSDLKASASAEVPNPNYSIVVGTKTVTIVPSGSSLTFSSMEVLKDNFTTGFNYGTTNFGKITAGTTYTMIWDGMTWKLGIQAADTTVLPWFYTNAELDTITSNANN
ncbi:MAG: clostripain-related cysteine peptidase, partial [bacterium]